MNSTSVSTSFATERRTSSGSAFQRGGAALLREPLELGAHRLELLHLDPRDRICEAGFAFARLLAASARALRAFLTIRTAPGQTRTPATGR